MTKRSQKMSDEDLRRALDYSVGDIVQIINGDVAGRVAEIISIGTYTTDKGQGRLIYNLKLSDGEGIRLTAPNFHFIRHADA